MTVAGVDLSLTRTGVCVDGVCTLVTSRRTGMMRLDDIMRLVHAAVDAADLVLIEGYAMGTGRQAGTYSIGELGGVIRWSMWKNDITFVEVPPATLKQFATGKGNANKDAMVATAARLGCPADDNNAVDAWWLYQLGVYGTAAQTVPAAGYRDAVAAKVAVRVAS